MQKVQFHFLDRKPTLQERTRLKLFIEKLFIIEKKKLGNLSYVFCSDEHLLGINRGFLKHDFYTDVITFDPMMRTAAESILADKFYKVIINII